jgi:hypothetical protein
MVGWIAGSIRVSVKTRTNVILSPIFLPRISALKGVEASNWFFLAMALWQLGEKDRSCSYFDQAVAWTKKNDPKNVELLQFWREAADLLGQPGPDASAPLPDLPALPFAP